MSRSHWEKTTRTSRRLNDDDRANREDIGMRKKPRHTPAGDTTAPERVALDRQRRELVARLHGAEWVDAVEATRGDPVLSAALDSYRALGGPPIDLATTPLYRRPAAVDEATSSYLEKRAEGPCSVCCIDVAAPPGAESADGPLSEDEVPRWLRSDDDSPLCWRCHTYLTGVDTFDKPTVDDLLSNALAVATGWPASHVLAADGGLLVVPPAPPGFSSPQRFAWLTPALRTKLRADLENRAQRPPASGPKYTGPTFGIPKMIWPPLKPLPATADRTETVPTTGLRKDQALTARREDWALAVTTEGTPEARAAIDREVARRKAAK